VRRGGSLAEVGVIGLGAMGQPIARNLVTSGFELMVFNRSPEKAEPLRNGAVLAASSGEVFERSEAILLVVPGEREIDQVLERVDEGVQAPVQNKIVINMATVAPGYSERLATAVAAAGGSYVEAPVSGSRRPAEAGTLIVLAAAEDESAIDRAQPVFDTIGKATVRCGVPPTAMRMKLANNLLLITLLEGIAEAVHFAGAIGLDLERFAEVVLAGPMANDIFRGKARKLLTRDFAPEASIKHVDKDIRLVCEEARRAGIHTPGASANAAILAAAVESGLADDDIVGVLKALELASGRHPR
jgi:3-hydroxyisobutyrate dehydrogenase